MFLFFLITLLTTLPSPANADNRSSPKAEQGVIDLRDWSFKDDGVIKLDGEWQFFWKQLIPPGDNSSENYSYRNVPGFWSDYGDDFSNTGFATYRLKILLPEHMPPLSVTTKGQSSAYRIWFDEQYIGGIGTVADSKEEMRATKRPAAYFLPALNGEVTLQIQISNFHHRKNGFRNPLLLGQAEDIHSQFFHEWIADAFILGITTSIGFYFLFIYLRRREDKAPLYFALMCLVVAIRAGFTSHDLLSSLFPGSAWAMLLKIEYLSFFWALYFYIGFMRSLYPHEFSSRLMKSNAIFASLFSIPALITDTLTASWLIPPYQVIHVLYVIVIAFCLIQIVYKKRRYYLYIAGASLIVGTLNAFELLNLEGYFPAANVSHFGFLAFIFVQAVMLSNRSADIYHQVSVLSNQLEARNRELQESELKYRRLFEDSSDTIFISTNNGRILDANPACEELLGFTSEELQQLRNLELVGSNEDRIVFAQEVQALGTAIDYKCELTHKDGHSVPVLITATPRYNEHGEQIGYHGYIRNMTDRVEASQQRKRAEELELIATLDPLTHIFNRRYFEKAANVQFEVSQRSGYPLSLILLDIDHFKNINDEYGHLIGDEVLEKVAEAIQQEVRKSDIFARYGGEEFALLMPGSNLEQAMRRSEHLREVIGALTIVSTTGAKIAVTASFGVSEWATKQTLKETLSQADEALYQAKDAGRNQSQSWSA